ncbi:MAG: amidohydrolase family protein [Candidatus Marinimicrobia bacterium]|jgi:imidazolonepropionase-like amidohydrolase/Tol biopolymer transport system component|nr:amidohydrolase family protein [Candidatus Neomarinimicrobiota bacterium]MBT4809544.1 amidohydrolase family protein [Candidatus Neomarinimicrobiota bacterium]MBT6129013.1 amidohydrolase family protein [Candidatus Neomarinimicrobiota bacterium]MBT7737815.1 amidohydrolase family protein [Candidatus Neomarinimicrobiota bacterium]
MHSFKLVVLASIFSMAFAQDSANHVDCCSVQGFLHNDSMADLTEPDDDDNKKWDVTTTHGPTKTIEFTTSEGTWMSLDVSPDGREIIFDLLGDLYTIPTTGGKATQITSGPAWDVQPTYSPNGKSIAFTSDRSGGDNIWIMDRDGSTSKQVSKESFRLLNNPVFTADGNYIIARKHFVNTRSLGAGEMWRYHTSGGKGVQVNKRRNWQHDAGEPDVSADGQYLYYSQDVSPGNSYQYNRDPYGQIYAVHRIDLETGEKTTAADGPGGAATPQISPNGKQLAFVRRVGLKTALFVKELASGNERMLFDNLNRDAQETWAIFGIHPGFSWTPNGKNIIITAKGGFWNVTVSNANVKPIPFTAEVEQKLTKPYAIKNEVGANAFEVKVLRHTRVSPNGKKVVFNALGKLYVANVDGSGRKRLTKQHNGLEYAPAWSPNGKQIAFTTWSDKQKGRLAVVSGNGGKPKFLKLPAGHYFDPSWSGDGSKLVYRRGGGSWIRGRDNSAKTGIYSIKVKGGKPKLVTKSGSEPHFTSGDSRILLMGREKDNRALYSVDLNGQDRRVLATSKYANRIILSPNEDWVLFDSRFHVYAAPFSKIGKAINLGPKTASIPVKQLTAGSGFEPHWSDNNSIHWTLGSELFSTDLKEAFTFVPGAPDSLPDPVESGTNLGWTATAPSPKGIVAITGATIITMDGDEVIENGIILIENNRIKKVGNSKMRIPKGAKMVDAFGKTIIPGLVDVHAHMGLEWDGLSSEQNWHYLANLAFGITTTHDPSRDTEMVFANSELQKSGMLLAPRIYSTGTILYGAVAGFTAEINSLDDAKRALERIKAFGGFSVKSYNQPRREQRQQILKAARELDMLVYPEGGSTLQHNLNMVADGHTGIEHSIPVSPLYKDALTLYGESGVGYTPTLIVSYGGIWGENYWYSKMNVFEHSRLQSFFPQQLLDQKRRRMKVEEDDWNHIENAKAAKALSDAGVKVNNGAHGQLQGMGLHWEMWMMAQGGMSPMEALKASTINGAEYLGMGDDLGSIEQGKLADLVILGKNPLKNIQNSDSVEMVMINGRLYDAATMNEVVTGNAKRKPLWWEKN